MSQFIKFYFTSSMLNMFRILIHPSSGACDLCDIKLVSYSSTITMMHGSVHIRSVIVFRRAQYRLYPGSHKTSPRDLPYVFTLHSCLILDIPGGLFQSGVPTYTYGVLIGLIHATSPAHPAINYFVLMIFCEEHILQRTSRYILPPYVQIFSGAPRYLNTPHPSSFYYQKNTYNFGIISHF